MSSSMYRYCSSKVKVNMLGVSSAVKWYVSSMGALYMIGPYLFWSDVPCTILFENKAWSPFKFTLIALVKWSWISNCQTRDSMLHYLNWIDGFDWHRIDDVVMLLSLVNRASLYMNNELIHDTKLCICSVKRIFLCPDTFHYDWLRHVDKYHENISACALSQKY